MEEERPEMLERAALALDASTTQRGGEDDDTLGLEGEDGAKATGRSSLEADLDPPCHSGQASTGLT